MSPRPSRLLALALASTFSWAGCGAPPAPAGNHLGMDVYLSRAVADELGAFQIVVLPEGRSRRCVDLQRTCLRQSVKATDPLIIESTDGQTGRALLFPSNLTERAQELGVNIPVGRNYVVVIEALSRSTPPRFLGSSCNYLDAVNGSGNDRLLAAGISLAAVECDPTFPP